MVPYDRPHVMEGVVGILVTAGRLLAAGEHRIVAEDVLAVPTNWPAEGASRSGVVTRPDFGIQIPRKTAFMLTSPRITVS